MSTTAEPVSANEAESTRMASARVEAEILRAVARVTQDRAAACMGVSPSTISRRLEHLPDWAKLLAAFGLQVVPVDCLVIDQEELSALESMAFKYLEARQQERRVRGG